MAEQDLPAMLGFVYQNTNTKINYIGYSQVRNTLLKIVFVNICNFLLVTHRSMTYNYF